VQSVPVVVELDPVPDVVVSLNAFTELDDVVLLESRIDREEVSRYSFLVGPTPQQHHVVQLGKRVQRHHHVRHRVQFHHDRNRLHCRIPFLLPTRHPTSSDCPCPCPRPRLAIALGSSTVKPPHLRDWSCTYRFPKVNAVRALASS
jgi:hypothetical protein